jgi:hypothetical protein
MKKIISKKTKNNVKSDFTINDVIGAVLDMKKDLNELRYDFDNFSSISLKHYSKLELELENQLLN